MPTYVETWDETKPAGTRARSLGDDDIREFKRAMRERLATDHRMKADETGDTQIGYHDKVTLIERSGDPTTVSDTGIIYSKDVGGVTELYFINSAGSVKQLTNGGALNVSSTEAVLLTGDQTVAGIKTFSSFPITPSSAPTTDYQVANKKYVDDKDHGTLVGLADHDHALYVRGKVNNVKIDYGTVIVADANPTAVSFNFTFASAPIVIALSNTAYGSDHNSLEATSITTTGCNIKCYDNSYPKTISWIAIGTPA